MLRAARLAQGIFYVVTGVWPLVSLRSFEMVTGPKVDDRLVRTVGLMLVVAGGALVTAALRRERSARDVWCRPRAGQRTVPSEVS